MQYTNKYRTTTQSTLMVIPSWKQCTQKRPDVYEVHNEDTQKYDHRVYNVTLFTIWYDRVRILYGMTESEYYMV